MSSNEEVDDYMSDKFLAGTSTVRPSLIQDRGKKRQIEIALSQKEHRKKQRDARAERLGENRMERLRESLERPLESANKGFQLLAKMGYKPGESLGKNTSGGITEPIAINIKVDRGGLGREVAIQDIKEKRKQLHEKRLREMRNETETVTIEDFRKRLTQKADERFTENALRKCQKSCEEIDCKNNLQSPHLPWFWPDRLKENENENENVDEENSDKEDDDFQYTSADKLEILIDYLRTSYNFCFWCGVHYDNAEDLKQDCPGLTKDEH